MPGSFQVNGCGGPPHTKGPPSAQSFSENDGQQFTYPYAISGTTRSGSGAALPSCAVTIFRSADNSIAAQGVSDANGAYRFPASPVLQHQVMAYLAGSPDVFGMTVNTIVGT